MNYKRKWEEKQRDWLPKKVTIQSWRAYKKCIKMQNIFVLFMVSFTEIMRYYERWYKSVTLNTALLGTQGAIIIFQALVLFARILWGTYYYDLPHFQLRKLRKQINRTQLLSAKSGVGTTTVCHQSSYTNTTRPLCLLVTVASA